MRAPLVAGRMDALQRQVLLVATLASFMAFLDGSVASLALPAISRELGGGLSAQQWVVDGYMLSLGALILVAGSLSDLFGRVRILQWGMIAFAATSVLCGVAPNDGVLIVGRILQGAAGALLVPSSLALIISNFAGAAQSKAIGTWTAWTGASNIIAPLLGGGLVDLLSWRLVFFINVVPVIFALPVLARMRGSDVPAAAGVRIDIWGTVLIALGLGGTVYALIEQSTFGWNSAGVLVPLLGGLLALAGFLVHESRTAKPMLPLSLFKIRNFSVGNVATWLIYGALSFIFFILGLYLQQIGKLPATVAGLAMLPSTLLLLALSAVFGAWAGRRGPRFLMAAGPMVAGLGLLFLIMVREPLNYWTSVFPALLIFGLGLAATVAPLTSAILGAVDPARAGVGSAVNNAVSRVAGLVTVACAGVVVGPLLDTAALHRSAIVAAALLIGGGLVSAWGIRNPAPQVALGKRAS